MTIVESRPDLGPAAGSIISSGDLVHRIEILARFKTRFADLTPARDRLFQRAIDEARDAAAGANDRARATALRTLDLLSLELADE